MPICKRSRYTDEELTEAVQNSRTWKEVCEKVGIKPGTGGATYVTKKVYLLKLDTSHFIKLTLDKKILPTLLLNKKFGKLTVIEFLGSMGKGNCWKCICDCGSETICSTGHLRSGNRVSCGCANRKRKTGLDNPKWNGYGEIGSTLWTKIQAHAKSRNLIFEISIEDAWELFLRQEKKCALSGIELNMLSTSHNRAARTASLDRIDSTRGYTKDNIQWIHKQLNWLKNNLPQEELIKWAFLITKHLSKNKDEQN